MNESEALKRLLTDQTRLYAGDRVPVRFAQQPHYAGPTHGGPYLAVNPDVNGWYDTRVSGANELRLLRDTLSHEAYEYRMGHPSAKAAFMLRHGEFHLPDGSTVEDLPIPDRAVPSPKAQAAGNVYNILRDAWVNTTRCRDFPGLRRTFAFKADLLAGDEDVSELPPAQAVLAGLHQIALTNTANGIRNADPEVRRLLAAARRYVERCRTAETHEELAALADAVFGKFEPLFEDPEDGFEELMDDLAGLHPDAQVEDMDTEDLADALDDAMQDPDTDLEPADDASEADVAVDMDAEDLPEDVDPEDMDGSGGGAPDEDTPTVDADDLDDDTLDAMADAMQDAEADEDGHEAAQDAASGDGAEDMAEDPADTMDGAHGDEDGLTDDASGEPETEADDAGGEPTDGQADGDGDEADEGDLDEGLGAGGGTGGDSTTDTGTETDAGDVDDSLLDDMDRLDDLDRPAGDLMGLDDEDDYHEPDAGDETRYERIKREQAFASTDWSERMDRRDAYGRRKDGDLPAEDIKTLMRETGLAEDLRRAFSRIKTREVREPTSRPRSKLHLKNVVRHMAGDYGVRDVYQDVKRGASGGRTIAAVVDASGSMNSSGSIGKAYGAHGAIVDAKVVLAALHLAAHEIGDRVVANAYDTTASDDVRLVTGPDETFSFDHLDGFSGVSASTATAAGVMDGIRLLERAGGSERVMVVITDGGANTDLSGTTWEGMSTGDGSVADARLAVETARDEGIKVIGVGVGSGVNATKLENTFGPDSWIHVESDDLVDEVVRIYREQLDDDRVAEATF